MKKWKVTLIMIGIIIIAGCVLRVYFNPENKIANFINFNEGELEKIALEYLAEEKTSTYGEREYYKNVEICGVQEGERPVVEFYHSGMGIAPSGVYYGFYYSPDDLPVSIKETERLLQPSGKEEWMWTGYGDNGGMTKRIKKNWFYYEAWF